MRHVKRIVIHCTSGWGTQTTQSIKDHWKKNLGWSQVGYHKLIGLDGTIENLVPLSVITNGVKGYNSDSVHICYKGGLVAINGSKYVYGDTRSPEQKEALYIAIKEVLEELSKTQSIDDVVICGHRDLSPDLNGNGKIEEREWVKICPAFDVKDMDELGWIMGRGALERIKHRKNY